MELSRTLSVLRRERRLSQEDLAERVGVTRQAVAKWEAGSATPDIANLVSLSVLFQVSVDALIRPDSCSGNGIAGVTPTDAGADPRGATGAKRAPEPGRSADVRAFLCRAKRATYAGKGAETASSRPSSHDLRYAEGDLVYCDTYLGGELFAGEEALWNGVTPFWSMNYVGRVVGDGFSGDFLKECLLLVPLDAPYRGPALHRDGRYTYHCDASGDFEDRAENGGFRVPGLDILVVTSVVYVWVTLSAMHVLERTSVIRSLGRAMRFVFDNLGQVIGFVVVAVVILLVSGIGFAIVVTTALGVQGNQDVVRPLLSFSGLFMPAIVLPLLVVMYARLTEPTARWSPQKLGRP